VASGAIAIIETGGVFAHQTIVAPATAVMRFNTDAVANGELIDAIAKRHDRAGPFVSGGELAIWDSWEEMAVIDLEVRATGAAHGNLD
jgi:hypothetical protein